MVIMPTLVKPLLLADRLVQRKAARRAAVAHSVHVAFSSWSIHFGIE